MRTGPILCILLTIAALSPAPLHGQTASVVPHIDLTGSIGSFSIDRQIGSFNSGPGITDTCCSWTSGFFRGISSGYYWTDHLKSEIEAAWPGRSEGYNYFSTRRPDGTFLYTTEEHHYTDSLLSVGQLYQFGRNATFHSFVGAGADLHRMHDDIERTTEVSRTLRVESEDERRTLVARPFLTTGFKAYMSERAFFRGELKLGVGNAIDRVTWKTGIGVDVGPRSKRRAGAVAAHRDAPKGTDPPDLWREYAQKLSIGSRVRLSSSTKENFVGTLLAVDDTGVLVKPTARVPEPPRHVEFERLTWLAPDVTSSAGERAAAIAAGVGTGTGVFYTLIFILLAHLD